VWKELAAGLQDAYAVASDGPSETYSSHNPHKRIDGIFADPRLTVVSCHAVQDLPGLAAASDHLPVLAVLRQ
jgi:endonuclease/exonuclease/phosphatase family metal-dependent hydrolase